MAVCVVVSEFPAEAGTQPRKGLTRDLLFLITPYWLTSLPKSTKEAGAAEIAKDFDHSHSR
jgi:hypothetical protein